jgi:hypothetical protein
VVDLDGHFERTKREGAEILSEIEHTHYGDRRYGSADLEGHHWYFAEKAERDPGGDAPTADDRDGHGRREWPKRMAPGD